MTMTCVKTNFAYFFRHHFSPGSAFLIVYCVRPAKQHRVRERRVSFHIFHAAKKGGNNRYLSVTSTQVAFAAVLSAIEFFCFVFTLTPTRIRKKQQRTHSSKRHSRASELLARFKHAPLPSSLLHSYSTYIVAHSTMRFGFHSDREKERHTPTSLFVH